MKYKNLTIIGTSHIAYQSVKDIEEAILKSKPDIIAIELDKKRLYGLLYKGKKKAISLRDIRRIGIKGFLFSLIGGYIQQKLGNKVGVMPGSEMLTAVRLAKKNNIKLALIDQDIEVTLKRFSKCFIWKEKFRLVADLFKGLVLRKDIIKFDLSKVPEKKIVRKLIKIIKKRYPSIYRVLVEERNEYMGSKLARLMALNENKKILAIVGAGHEEELIDIIKKKRIDVVSYSYSVG